MIAKCPNCRRVKLDTKAWLSLQEATARHATTGNTIWAEKPGPGKSAWEVRICAMEPNCPTHALGSLPTDDIPEDSLWYRRDAAIWAVFGTGQSSAGLPWSSLPEWHKRWDRLALHSHNVLRRDRLE